MRVRRCASPWTLCLPAWVGEYLLFQGSSVEGSLCLAGFIDSLSWGTLLGPPVAQHCASGAGGGLAGDGSTQRSPGHCQPLGYPGGFVCC